MHATTIQACHRLGKVLNCELIKLTQNNVWKLAQLESYGTGWDTRAG